MQDHHEHQDLAETTRTSRQREPILAGTVTESLVGIEAMIHAQ